jgi:hypothetical protein
MQYQLETINTNMQTWNEEEIRDLILYAKSLQQEVDDKSAQLIMMNAKLENEESKNRKLNNIIKLLYGKGNNPYSTN